MKNPNQPGACPSPHLMRNPPHPDPLAEGEGTAKFGREQTSDVGFADRLRTILPLPLGEGRGEGSLDVQLLKIETRPALSP
jgi:hypothetical protein